MNMTQACGIQVIPNVSCDENSSFSSSRAFPSPLGMPHEAGFDVAIELYLISLIGVIGLLGNIVSLVVLRQDKERREALLLLQALAVSDALYVIMALIRYPLKYLIHDPHQYHQMQVIVFPLLKTFQAITIWMMVLVTVDRYIYVCFPLRAQQIFNKRTRRLFVVGVFVFGVIFTLPRFFEKCVTTFSSCNRHLASRVIYRTMFHNTYYYNIYLYGMFIIFLYIIPLTNLFAMNVRLIVAIRRSKQRHHVMHIHSYSNSYSNGTSSYTSHTESNATLVLIIIILVFIVCETPECVLRILTALEHHNIIKTITPTFFRYNTVSALLMVINSSINFFIYLIFGKRFRYILKETFIYRLQSSMTLFTRESIPLNRQNLYG